MVDLVKLEELKARLLRMDTPGSPNFLVDKDGKPIAREAAAALSSARAEIERLREALKPFAELAKHFTNAPDDGWIWRAEEPLEITVGHLRCAAAALIREQEE